MGIESLKFFRDAIYSNSENGKLLWLNLQYSQLEAGALARISSSFRIFISPILPQPGFYHFVNSCCYTICPSQWVIHIRFHIEVLLTTNILCKSLILYGILLLNKMTSTLSVLSFKLTRSPISWTTLNQRQSICLSWVVNNRRVLLWTSNGRDNLDMR